VCVTTVSNSYDKYGTTIKNIELIISSYVHVKVILLTRN